MDNIALLDAIDAMVNPLHPPVQAFETSIRKTPFRILISVLISSRTKDAVTHKASEKLFGVAETPKAMNELTETQIATYIYPVGFYKQKAKHIKQIAAILTASPGSNGDVPNTLAELTALPGVGQKTANLVLALAFGKPAIAVDIHVFRISRRLGWATAEKPAEVEQELNNTFPPEQWNRINQTLVGFGQTLCKPVRPLCQLCQITPYCHFFAKNQTTQTKEPKRKK